MSSGAGSESRVMETGDEGLREPLTMLREPVHDLCVYVCTVGEDAQHIVAPRAEATVEGRNRNWGALDVGQHRYKTCFNATWLQG